jgi:hypothetical protein
VFDNVSGCRVLTSLPGPPCRRIRLIGAYAVYTGKLTAWAATLKIYRKFWRLPPVLPG